MNSFDLQLKLHERGLKLELSIYNDVCLALSDDHENVRQCALKMIWVLSHSYPERLVTRISFYCIFYALLTGSLGT